ncbi:MAG: hypothetical protein Q9223_006358 [Gallowayella weberi]
MARFSHLPNELLILILSFVAVEDFESFAQVTPSFYVLARPQLEEHRRLCRDYSNIRIPWDNISWTFDFVETIMKSSHIGHYIRRLEVNAAGLYHSTKLAESEIDFLQQEVSSRAIFSQSVAELDSELRNTIRQYPRDVLISLIVLHAPNINSIKASNSRYLIRESGWQSVWLRDIFHQAASGGAPPVLCRLKSVRMDEETLFADQIQDLLRIPSVRVLKLAGLKGEGSDWNEGSHIDTLKFNNHRMGYNFVDSTLLRALLPKLQHLTRLDVKIRIFGPEHSADMETLADVLSPVRSTLRRLKLLCPTGDSGGSIIRFLGSFVGFGALEYLATHFDGIYPQLLPGSLQTLKLYGRAYCIYGDLSGGDYSARVFLDRLLERYKSGENLKLKDLQFTSPLKPPNQEAYEMLKKSMELCTRAGVKMRAPDVVENKLPPISADLPPISHIPQNRSSSLPNECFFDSFFDPVQHTIPKPINIQHTDSFTVDTQLVPAHQLEELIDRFNSTARIP